MSYRVVWADPTPQAVSRVLETLDPTSVTGYVFQVVCDECDWEDEPVESYGQADQAARGHDKTHADNRPASPTDHTCICEDCGREMDR